MNNKDAYILELERTIEQAKHLLIQSYKHTPNDEVKVWLKAQWVNTDILEQNIGVDDYKYEIVRFLDLYRGNPDDIDEKVLRNIPLQELHDFNKSLEYADSLDYRSFEAEQFYKAHTGEEEED